MRESIATESETLMTDSPFSYDTVPYPSYTFPQTHPDRLSTIGSLYGVATSHPESCRTLELGCGDGTNLMSFAYALPQSRFIGVDLSSAHIFKARTAAAELHLDNISFQQEDIGSLLPADFGKFDFIIAHGLFSWVPDKVRDNLLRIFGECLDLNGVGYISYNAYPGCHIREIASEIMKFGSAAHADPIKQVESGRKFLEVIAGAAENDSLYQAMLNIELSHIVDRSDQNVFHDDLADINRPFYFNEFAEMLNSFGLQFISEADPVVSYAGKLSDNGRALLLNEAENRLRKEQLIDLITCRRFRSTVICRSEHSLNAAITPDAIHDYLISGRIDSDSLPEEVRSQNEMVFTCSDGTSVSIDHPLTKAAIKTLRNIYARRISFTELIVEAGNFLGRGEPEPNDVVRTANILTEFYSAGMLSLHRYQPEYIGQASEMPRASDFARWQLQNGSESVTSLAGPNLVPGNAITKSFLSLLDGTLTREQIMEQLELLVDVPSGELATFRSALPEMVDTELKRFAEAGLLIA